VTITSRNEAIVNGPNHAQLAGDQTPLFNSCRCGTSASLISRPRSIIERKITPLIRPWKLQLHRLSGASNHAFSQTEAHVRDSPAENFHRQPGFLTRASRNDYKRAARMLATNSDAVYGWFNIQKELSGTTLLSALHVVFWLDPTMLNQRHNMTRRSLDIFYDQVLQAKVTNKMLAQIADEAEMIDVGLLPLQVYNSTTTEREKRALFRHMRTHSVWKRRRKILISRHGWG
jgi:hypothetical protein